jgi:hypothetical protein
MQIRRDVRLIVSKSADPPIAETGNHRRVMSTQPRRPQRSIIRAAMQCFTIFCASVMRIFAPSRRQIFAPVVSHRDTRINTRATAVESGDAIDLAQLHAPRTYDFHMTAIASAYASAMCACDPVGNGVRYVMCTGSLDHEGATARIPSGKSGTSLTRHSTGTARRNRCRTASRTRTAGAARTDRSRLAGHGLCDQFATKLREGAGSRNSRVPEHPLDALRRRHIR